MKIAFLFMFYNDHCKSDYMQEYFHKGVDKHNIYTHFKNPDGYKKSKYFGKFSISKHIETKHCDISLVECQLNLLEAALKQTENQWFVFMSGSCLPIKPLSVLYDFLESHKISFFDTICHPEPQMTAKSLNSWIGEWNRSYLNYIFSKFKKHSQWCILNRMDAEILVDTKSKHLPAWKGLQYKFNKGFAKDEYYPLAVLSHEIENYQYNDIPTTYVKWCLGKTKPETFTAIDFLNSEYKSSFFIRKINNKTIIK
jgi:hypothetical protein